MRPSSELIPSLRTLAQELDENFASPEDQAVIELRRILLHRIADLEGIEVAAANRDVYDSGESPA